MEIKIKHNFFDGYENQIGLCPGEEIFIHGDDEKVYIKIKCNDEGKILITTNYTKNMKNYDLIEASQRLLGYPVKNCVCGDKRGGLPHLHPLYVPLEFED